MKKISKLDLNKLKSAFTLAEVLITLVIIGVVAAITVPMLMNDTNDKQYVAGMQKARATIGEALRMATVNGEITKDYTTKEFVEKVLSKYLKIAKQCDISTDCGFSSKVKRTDGTSMDLPESWTDSTYAAVATQPTINGTWSSLTEITSKYDDFEDKYNKSTYFQTLDGYSVNFFYNPYCAYNSKDILKGYTLSVPAYYQQTMDIACFNAVYDMNGNKGPNQVGKDIGFIASFYNSYEVQTAAVLPFKTTEEKTLSEIVSSDGNSWLSALNYCNNLHDDDWILPDVNELSVLYLNNMLLHGEKSTASWYISRSPLEGTSNRFRHVDFRVKYGGHRVQDINTTITSGKVICVRRNALK